MSRVRRCFFSRVPVTKLKLSRKITNHESRNHPTPGTKGMRRGFFSRLRLSVPVNDDSLSRLLIRCESAAFTLFVAERSLELFTVVKWSLRRSVLYRSVCEVFAVSCVPFDELPGCGTQFFHSILWALKFASTAAHAKQGRLDQLTTTDTRRR